MNQFFKDRFPGIASFASSEGAAVKSLKTKIPSTTGGYARLVGTAFDYRLRIYFDPRFLFRKLGKGTYGLHGLFSDGISRLERSGSGLGSRIDHEWADITTQVLFSELPEGDEELLAQASVVFALLDWGCRNDGMWTDALRTIARAIGDGHDVSGWNDYATLVDREVASEVANIMGIVDPPPANVAILGPTFDGSRFVGGADGDLILDRCLYDVKTTQNPRGGLTPWLRQLIGYALLDWDDGFRLSQVGFYFSRQGAWISWRLSDLVRRTAASGRTLSELRDEFRTVALIQSEAAMRGD